MAINVVGTVSKIKTEVAQRQDGTKYDKHKLTIATKNQDGSVAFFDLPVYLTKNVDKSLINDPVEIQSGWLGTNGETLHVVVNKVVKPETKTEGPF